MFRGSERTEGVLGIQGLSFSMFTMEFRLLFLEYFPEGSFVQTAPHDFVSLLS